MKLEAVNAMITQHSLKKLSRRAFFGGTGRIERGVFNLHRGNVPPCCEALESDHFGLGTSLGATRRTVLTRLLPAQPVVSNRLAGLYLTVLVITFACQRARPHVRP